MVPKRNYGANSKKGQSDTWWVPNVHGIKSQCYQILRVPHLGEETKDIEEERKYLGEKTNDSGENRRREKFLFWGHRSVVGGWVGWKVG